MRYRAMPFPSSKSGPLPKQRTQECHPFQVIGVDYAGPIYTDLKTRQYQSLRYYYSRAVYPELFT